MIHTVSTYLYPQNAGCKRGLLPQTQGRCNCSVLILPKDKTLA